MIDFNGITDARGISDAELDAVTRPECIGFERRAEIIAVFVKHLSREADALKEAEEQLKNRRRIKETETEYLKKYLLECLEKEHISRLSTPSALIYVSDGCAAVSVSDETEFIRRSRSEGSDLFLRYPAPEIDRYALKQALENGEKIPLAALEKNKTIIIK